MLKINPDELDLEERVVLIKRVAKVVKGGRRFKLSALVVVGNRQGYVGVGLGKGKEVPVAIKKAVQSAKKNLIEVPLVGATIPHQMLGCFGAGRVLLKPASLGTGIIAGGAVRPIMELAGIKDVLTKSLGSSNAMNIARATIAGLENLQRPPQTVKPKKVATKEKKDVKQTPKVKEKVAPKAKSSAGTRLKKEAKANPAEPKKKKPAKVSESQAKETKDPKKEKESKDS